MDAKVCSDIMTPDPVCCVPGDTIERAAALMKEQDVGSVPVVDDAETRKLVGIITDRDIVLKLVAAGKSAKRTKVRGIMQRDLVTARPGDAVQSALELMARRQVRRIPVIGEDGKLCGIIAQADVATRTDETTAVGEVVSEISQPREDIAAGTINEEPAAPSIV
jgi:CBS domain-containing protein